MIVNYKQLHSLLLKYKQNDSAARLIRKIAQAGKGIHNETGEFQINGSISPKDMNDIIAPMINGNNMEASFKCFAKSFVPDKAREKNSFEKDYAHSFMSAIPTPLFDNKGHLKAIVGDVNTDFDGNLIMHVSL